MWHILYLFSALTQFTAAAPVLPKKLRHLQSTLEGRVVSFIVYTGPQTWYASIFTMKLQFDIYCEIIIFFVCIILFFSPSIFYFCHVCIHLFIMGLTLDRCELKFKCKHTFCICFLRDCSFNLYVNWNKNIYIYAALNQPRSVRAAGGAMRKVLWFHSKTWSALSESFLVFFSVGIIDS